MAIDLKSYLERNWDWGMCEVRKSAHAEYSSKSVRLNPELDMVEIISFRDLDEGYSWYRNIVSYLVETSDFQSCFEELLKRESIDLKLNAIIVNRQARFDHAYKTNHYEPSDDYQISTGRGILSGRLKLSWAGGIYRLDLSDLKFEQQSTEEKFVISFERECSQRINDIVGRMRQSKK